MKLKEAKWILDGIEGFACPKIKYEQYMTPSELACAVVHVMAVEYNDIQDKDVLDLGCGTGMLSAAVILYGANKVMGIDIDSSVEDKYNCNLSKVSEGQHTFCNLDVQSDEFGSIPQFNTAIINPPFGTKNNSGIDAIFLEKALEKADVVYSMHKTSTREYFKNKYSGRIKVLSKMYFELKKTYKFQKKESVHVEVDLIRVTRA
ncbi:rRNA N6-adenosine-methyltransferase METTL5 [Nematocida parisii]|nr:rRNA N6-adenosine-methyltransferase METTL5 [Nematocida parisii]KAI5157389.1 rRNA N6-adenosine-methyltransferase METTL5 [Nematocida parisii]